MKETLAHRGLLEAGRRLLVESDDMTVSTLCTFLGVCLWGYDKGQNQPLSIEELADRIGLPYTSVARHIRQLGEGDKLRKPGQGMKLVDTAVYPLNRRQKVAFLTAKGKALAANLEYILERAITNADQPQGQGIPGSGT